MLVLGVKGLHVVAAAIFLGGGILTAYFKVRADGSGDPRVLAWYQREIVRADWTFTVPSGLIAPATGAWLVHAYELPWSTPWVLWGVGGWAVAGLFWLPAALLQIKMDRLARLSLEGGTALHPDFHRANRQWMLLGVPSFAAAIFTVWVMIAKWSL